jgi:hypothetical protein
MGQPHWLARVFVFRVWLRDDALSGDALQGFALFENGLLS